MSNKIRCVLLIDDNPADNYYHKLIIEDSEQFDTINIVENGLEALDYLNNKKQYQDKTLFPKPSIIFLDINMPRMNGFEFMEEYSKMDNSKKAEICIIMLSTSKNLDHLEISKGHKELSDYFTKPLDDNALNTAISLFKEKTNTKINSYN